MKPVVITFLQRLYRTDRILFVLVVAYVCGILYYCSRQREEFPFLLYGMYSLKEESKPVYINYIIEAGKKEIPLSGLSDSKKELITSSITNAANLYYAGQLNKEQQGLLKVWLYDIYTSHFLSDGYDVNIYRLICAYNGQGKPVIIKKDLLF